MQVSVTQEDIDLGIRGSCSECPVARAMTRAGFLDVSICPGLLVWRGGPAGRRGFTAPKHVTEFIIAFDSEGSGQPFTFEVP